MIVGEKYLKIVTDRYIDLTTEFAKRKIDT